MLALLGSASIETKRLVTYQYRDRGGAQVESRAVDEEGRRLFHLDRE
jgi:hypothetical protein